MNIDDIRLFILVFRSGGFSAVAAEQNIAPSSVSRRIAALEAHLGVRLFQRTTRTLAPTTEGEHFFRTVEPLIDELSAAMSTLDERTRRPSGRLRVSASVAFGQAVILPNIARFRKRYPEIDLDLVLMDTLADLVSERIDLAVRHGELKDSSLVASRLASVYYRLVAAPQVVPSLAGPDDIAAARCIVHSLPGQTPRWRFKRAGDDKTIIPGAELSISSALGVREAARQGLGLAVLADWLVDGDIEAGRLVQVLADWDVTATAFGSALWLVRPSRRYVPAKTDAFASFLRESLAAS